MNILARREDQSGLVESIIYYVECTFHVNGNANPHSVLVWRTRKVNECLEHVRATIKIIVFFELNSEEIYYHFGQDTSYNCVCVSPYTS